MSSQRSAAAQRARPQGDIRLTLRHNPIGLIFSASLWRSAGYLGSYLVVGSLLSVVALATSIVAAVLSITVVAVPLLIAAAEVIRGCAAVERGMLGQVFAQPVHADYPALHGDGLWKQARARWNDSATWRDLACLVGLWPALQALAVAVLAVWATFLAGVTLPLWYSRAPGLCVGVCGSNAGHGVMIGYYPHGMHGPGHHGFLVDTLPTALLAAAGFAVLFLLFNYVLVATARLHAQVARAVLGQSADPLAPARAVLAGPGPLGPLVGPVLSGQGPSSSGGPDGRLLR
ncbi:MAG TPA: sensor domain-containing protein [Streptosporangiaceae bacterium]|nr:sensor domain-containing protein [Streptosporangiaceae bacterium]